MARKTTGKIVPVAKVWLSKDEAMAYLGCSDKFLTTLRDKAEVAFARYGNKMYWYELGSIERFIKRNTVLPQVK